MARKSSKEAKPVTLQNIAGKASVSVKTVSLALRGSREVAPATARRIRAVATRAGYIPRSTGTNALGLIVPNLRITIYSELARSIRECASERGMSLLLGDGGGDPHGERSLLSEFRSRRIEGLILVSPRISAEDIAKISRLHQPVVTVFSLADSIAGMNFGSVKVTNKEGAYRAVEHLLSQGRRHIAYLAGHLLSPSDNERRAGYSEALRDLGLAPDDQMVVELDGNWPTLSAGYKRCEDLLSRGITVDAIFAYNDLMAIGAMRMLRERKISVPDQISVIGFDDSEVCDYVTPRLSSVGVPLSQVATRVIETLSRMGSDRKMSPEALHHVLPTHLTIRESSMIEGS